MKSNKLAYYYCNLLLVQLDGINLWNGGVAVIIVLVGDQMQICFFLIVDNCLIFYQCQLINK